MKTNTLEETYDLCICNGTIKEKTKDTELIKSLKTLAEKGLEFINKSKPQDSTDWTFVFRDYHESLNALIDAYILFDGIETDNNQCKYAYLCIKHPELELNWEFLETIRTKRNAINTGILLKYEDWKTLKLNFELHISALRKEIELKLSS